MHISVRISSEENFDPNAFVRALADHCDRDCVDFGGPAVVIDGYDAYADLRPAKKSAGGKRKKSASKKK